jgi:hypothetical protein
MILSSMRLKENVSNKVVELVFMQCLRLTNCFTWLALIKEGAYIKSLNSTGDHHRF